MAEAKITLQCPMCSVVKSDFKKLVFHLQLLHEHTANFSVACHICSALFTRVDSLRKHFYRKHGAAGVACNDYESHGVDDNNDDDADYGESMDVDTNEGFTNQSEMSVDLLCSELQRHVNLFLLQLQEKHVLPHSVQETVTSSVSFVVEYLWSNVSDIIKNMLTALNLEIEDNSDLNILLSNKELFQRIFADSASHYKIEKFSRAKLNLVAPTEVVLTAPCASKCPSNKFVFHYVSILETLRNLLSNTAILHYIMSETEGRQQTHTGLKRYSSYTDGEIYANHTLFSKHRICLRLHFYTDEFEVVNPLGSKKGKHKQIAFYFTIGNLPVRFNSQLCHIHLCLLAKYSLLHKSMFSYKDLLGPLIKDLNTLESEGIPINVNGCEMRIFGGIATISSDNLSAHALAGFAQSFSSGRVCRFCMIVHGDIATKSTESDCHLRTPEMHRYHVDAVTSNPSISKSTYGVTGACAFDALNYFSTTQVFCPDLMHDFLEGIVPLLLKVMLQSFVQELKYFGSSFINNKLDTFRFGKNDRKAKPVHIPVNIFRSSAEASLSGKAIEKWCLFRILPFLIGALVPAGDVKWRAYLLSREIADILFAVVITEEDTAYLRMLIGEFIQLFVELFPGRITPKFHYLLHYPAAIEKFGPVKSLWCMRFEAKHQYFKRVAHVMCNFKNVSFTLAKRHQLRQCWEQNSGDFLKEEPEYKLLRSLKFGKLSLDTQELLRSRLDVVDDIGNESVMLCSSLQLMSVKYEVSDFFVIDCVEAEEVPVFFRISHIVNCRSLWFLLGRIYIPESFHGHFHAYIVNALDKCHALVPGEELDHHALDGYTVGDDLYVSLHHKVHRKA